jgi:hypothetical protein
LTVSDRIRKEFKREDLKIQECLRHKKGTQGIKGPRQRNFKLKDEAAKIGCSDLGF